VSSGFLGIVIGPRWRAEGVGGDGAPPSSWVIEGRFRSLGLGGLCVPNEFAAFVDELADLEGEAGLALHELVHGGAFYVEKFFCGEA
jgi:hypothetical protein